MSTCPYANILGESGKGVHATRLYGFAANDIYMTIIAAAATAYIFHIHILYSLTGWFVLGEVLHYIFGTNTAFLVMLGLNRC